MGREDASAPDKCHVKNPSTTQKSFKRLIGKSPQTLKSSVWDLKIGCERCLKAAKELLKIFEQLRV